MGQKPIVLDLRMKGMAFDAIHDDLVCMLGKDAVVYSTVTKYARMLAALSFQAERKSHLPKLQMLNAVLLMRQYSRLLPNFRFRFHLCSSFRGGSVFRDLPYTSTGTGIGTSRNHFASPCNISDGSHTFDGGVEADSGSDGNRTISGPLGAKHASVARNCHLE
jgi:hypothetical protein